MKSAYEVPLFAVALFPCFFLAYVLLMKENVWAGCKSGIFGAFLRGFLLYMEKRDN